MKSEHRHDLQTNELGKVTEKLSHVLEVHGNRIMIGICVVSLAVSGGIYWYRSVHSREAAAWSMLATATKSDDYSDVWETHKGSTAAQWARVHEGESRLSQGVQTLFRNLETGTTELQKAREAFQTVVDDRGAPKEIRERALIGLARTLESMSDGSEGDAVKTYELLLKEFPDSIYKKDAESRIAALNSGSGQEFYAWFAKFARPKPSEKRPRDKALEELDEESADLLKKLDSASRPDAEAGDAKTLPDSKGAEETGEKEQESPAAEPGDSGAERPAKEEDKATGGASSGGEPRPEPVPEPEDSSRDDAQPEGPASDDPAAP